MSIKYEYWARLATPGAKENTFGQFHLIPKIDRFPSSTTHALCGKLGIVITPQKERPIWDQRCKNCIRLKLHPHRITIGKVRPGFYLDGTPFRRKRDRS